jgi:hypothetical protein
VAPEEVGLPGGGRRRTPGLRREELAQLAGVGVTWYTWLEQGRPINASGQVLDAVATTLRLTPIEREHLYRLAEATPMRLPRTADCASEAVFEEIVEALDPLPAVITNTRFDIIRANRAYNDLFHDWHQLPCVHKNQLWCIITEPSARDQLLNYDTEVPTWSVGCVPRTASMSATRTGRRTSRGCGRSAQSSTCSGRGTR